MNKQELIVSTAALAARIATASPARASRLRATAARLAGNAPAPADAAYDGPAIVLATFVDQHQHELDSRAARFAVGEGAAAFGQLLGELRDARLLTD